MAHTHTLTHTQKLFIAATKGKCFHLGCCCTAAASKYIHFVGWCGTCSRYSIRAKNKMYTWYYSVYIRGFPWPCLARRVGKRSHDYLPDQATLNAQSMRHGARLGPKLSQYAKTVYLVRKESRLSATNSTHMDRPALTHSQHVCGAHTQHIHA